MINKITYYVFLRLNFNIRSPPVHYLLSLLLSHSLISYSDWFGLNSCSFSSLATPSNSIGKYILDARMTSPQYIRNPRINGINLNCYYLHILGVLCSQIVYWYLFDGFSQYLCLHHPIYDCQSGYVANCVPFLWLPSKLLCNGPNLYLFLHMWIRFLEQLKSLKTNGKRKNVWSIFLILKPMYVKDLTLDLSD